MVAMTVLSLTFSELKIDVKISAKNTLFVQFVFREEVIKSKAPTLQATWSTGIECQASPLAIKQKIHLTRFFKENITRPKETSFYVSAISSIKFKIIEQNSNKF